jgi:hypothetical protein
VRGSGAATIDAGAPRPQERVVDVHIHRHALWTSAERAVEVLRKVVDGHRKAVDA